MTTSKYDNGRKEKSDAHCPDIYNRENWVIPIKTLKLNTHQYFVLFEIYPLKKLDGNNYGYLLITIS
jgi:hypothetical protein